MSEHGFLTVDNGIHIPFQWSFANASERTSATGFFARDLFKLAHQEDDNTLWMLVDISPTWERVSGEIPAELNDLTDVTLTAEENDEQLFYDTGQWVNKKFGDFTEKEAPVSDDMVLVEDSEDFNLKKRVKLSNILSGDYPFNVITVDAENPDADFDNIASAVEVASSGDVILIGPGFYEVDELGIGAKAITLIGQGRFNTEVFNDNLNSTSIFNVSANLEIHNLGLSLGSDTASDVSVISRVTSSPWIFFFNADVYSTNLGVGDAYILDGASLSGFFFGGQVSAKTSISSGNVNRVVFREMVDVVVPEIGDVSILKRGFYVETPGLTPTGEERIVSADDGREVATYQTANVTTTDDTQTAFDFDGRLDLPDNSTWGFIAYISARRTDFTGENAFFKIEGVIKRDSWSATAVLVGTITKTVIARDEDAWDVSAVADTTDGALEIRVTGETSKDINWYVKVDLTKVGT